MPFSEIHEQPHMSRIHESEIRLTAQLNESPSLMEQEGMSYVIRNPCFFQRYVQLRCIIDPIVPDSGDLGSEHPPFRE